MMDSSSIKMINQTFSKNLTEKIIEFTKPLPLEVLEDIAKISNTTQYGVVKGIYAAAIYYSDPLSDEDLDLLCKLKNYPHKISIYANTTQEMDNYYDFDSLEASSFNWGNVVSFGDDGYCNDPLLWVIVSTVAKLDSVKKEKYLQTCMDFTSICEGLLDDENEFIYINPSIKYDLDSIDYNSQNVCSKKELEIYANEYSTYYVLE